MFELKNPRIAIQLVLIAGIFWSFGAYVVRLIDQPQTVPWQYLFTRGIVIFTLLNFYLYLEENDPFPNAIPYPAPYLVIFVRLLFCPLERHFLVESTECHQELLYNNADLCNLSLGLNLSYRALQADNILLFARPPFLFDCKHHS